MDTPTPEVAAQAPEEVSSPLNVDATILKSLAQARTKIGSMADPVDLVIPGYDGRVKIRFRWVPVNELAATSKQLQKIKEPTQQQLAACADALVATCDGILINVGDDTESQWETLQHLGVDVTFANGEGLALAFGFPKPRSARDCVFALFNNEYAMVDVTQKVMSWLEDTSREVDAAHLGE